MRLLLVCVMLVLLSSCSVDPADAEAVNDTLEDLMIESLEVPWDFEFDGDRIFITERPGRVRLFENGSITTIAQIAVDDTQEAGLLGIALHPEFPGEPHVYLYYTASEDNRISRFIFDGEKLVNETVLLDDIPNALFHDGGALDFGPDGLLYATTGDATDPSSAQDLDSLAGKILRMTPGGAIPEDNPFGSYVYSYGHRNPQGLAWANGTLYASEHGPSSHDEINRIEAGANYGWPDRCGEQPEDSIEPIRCFDEFTLAPNGLAYANGSLYVAGLRGAQVRELALENGNVASERVVVDGVGRIRSLAIRDGVLYYGTSNRDGRGRPRSGDDRIVAVSPE